MNSTSIVALDIGGTKINIGRYKNKNIEINQVLAFCAQASADEILTFIIACIDKMKDDSTMAIAIGVPCIVDTESGTVYDAVNIESWQKVTLKSALQQHYQLPVYINNDVNCFTAGEHVVGAGQGYNDLIGLCLGTGFGVGFVLNNQLHAGNNCSAGELGSLRYLNSTIDDYCSGHFFKQHYQLDGAALAEKARAGDEEARQAFADLGKHLAHAITTLLLVVDPQLIVIGGSVAKSFDLFIDALWQELKTFPYQRVIERLNIVQSSNANSALIGAAELYLKHQASQIAQAS